MLLANSMIDKINLNIMKNKNKKYSMYMIGKHKYIYMFEISSNQ
jgi:hypothetical protein